MFNFDFSILKKQGINVTDFVAILNGDFKKASKLGTALLIKHEPNMVEGMAKLSERYEENNITIMLSVQHEEGLDKVLRPFICVDVCSVEENSQVNVLESFSLTQLPEFLASHYQKEGATNG